MERLQTLQGRLVVGMVEMQLHPVFQGLLATETALGASQRV